MPLAVFTKFDENFLYNYLKLICNDFYQETVRSLYFLRVQFQDNIKCCKIHIHFFHFFFVVFFHNRISYLNSHFFVLSKKFFYFFIAFILPRINIRIINRCRVICITFSYKSSKYFFFPEIKLKLETLFLKFIPL